MPNFNSLILTGANFNVILRLENGNFYPILTGEEITWDDASEGETIHAIGYEDPIGEKSNANSYKGKLSMQLGELTQILNLNGIPSANKVRNATITVTAVVGAFIKTFSGVNFNRSAAGPKRGGKETINTIDFAAVGVS